MLLCIRAAGRLEVHCTKLVAGRLRTGRLAEHESGRCHFAPLTSRKFPGTRPVLSEPMLPNCRMRQRSPREITMIQRAFAFAVTTGGFDRARSGRRQLLFLTGEPGIGKSSLADAFLDQLRASRAVKIA